MNGGTRSTVLVVLEGVFANFLFGSLFVWSVLRNPFLELFPDWNEGMLSLIFGIHNLFVCAGIILGGQLCRKFSARRAFLLFAALMFIGLGGFVVLPENDPQLSYIMAFVFFCLFAATGAGIGISVVQSTTIPWFPKNSGAISGALYMALGVSSVVLAAMADKLLPLIGVKNVLPVFGTIILLVALIILCDRQSVTKPDENGAGYGEEFGMRPGEMLRSAAFWVLAIWNISLRTAGLILLDHAAGMAAAFGGSAIVAMLIAPANGLGCISVGVAMDSLGIRRIMVIEAVIMTAAGVLLCFGTQSGAFVLIFVGLLLAGFAYGGSSSSYAASVKNCFGSKYYSQTFAISNIAMGCAALLEATSGTVLDMSGSYFYVVLMVLALALIAFCLSLFTKRAKL